MRLERKLYPVNDVVFAGSSRYESGVVYLDVDELKAKTLLDISGLTFDVKLTKPGESCRIVHVMDTLIPACKHEGAVFSGWPEKNPSCGNGVTYMLDGVTVMQTGVFAGIQEGIVDMSGAGSCYSEFSKTINIVLSLDLLNKQMSKPDYEKASKTIILRAGEYLGSLCMNNKAHKTSVFELNPVKDGLPRVGYACFIQAQGNLRNVFVHGQEYTESRPILIHPNEMLDGGIVSSNFIIACQKNPTCYYQKNPVVNELYRLHGQELDFCGVIISNEANLLEEKTEYAASIASIARELKLDGLIVSQEGGGHADVDLMLTAEACEPNIKTVLLANEIAGPKGELPPLVSFSSAADAIVSAGNNDEIVTVGAVDTLIGGDSITGIKTSGKDSFETSLGIFYTATNQMGAHRMTTVEY